MEGLISMSTILRIFAAAAIVCAAVTIYITTRKR